ncbi:hypothetical protein HNP46_007146 [Pseudomonas nitritireducens]|uniref:Uncharacterized protein n=1 Tax=Pseudomonas nitroreducens TaxID=46680 RepID=A0A7W7KSX9_PSENT|nr:hypothetical protein [Pseudomonas nitritireducens]MBB4868226.1 hypothetical protein [Pseudomonas nitritireducens]
MKKNHCTRLIALATTLAAATASANVDNPKEPIPVTQAAIAGIAIPTTHVQAEQRAVVVDNEGAVLTRYIRSDKRNAELSGEHFSTVVSNTGKLKGFANISLDLVGKPLPSRELSEQIARVFLQKHAPDLLERMKISWIEPHDEPLTIIRDGREELVTVTGMKVKARNLADGRWFWIIVGSDEKPMVFERDIVWITFPGKRKTEKWLHDSWLAEQRAKSTSTPL